MKTLTQGNEAIFRGALKAGASFFAGYPICPATEVMVLAAEYAESHPEFRFLQCEDEISAANAVVGGSLAGAKSFTATSGPGFSLMQEAIGYAHKVEVPCVFVNSQRVGPGTGMPTMPAQGDLWQAKYGSSGDYYPIVFYPNSVAECCKYTAIAFNAAEEALSPVVVLTDAFVSHLNETVDLDEIQVEVIARRLPPLGAGKRSFSGLNVDERGHPATANAEVYKQWISKVKTRCQEVAPRYRFYEYRRNPSSNILLISFGIVSRVVEPLAPRFSMFRPISIHPVLGDELREAAKQHETVVVVEANDGQYAYMVEHAIRREVISIPLLGGKMSLSLVTRDLREKLKVEVG
ncbi:MAG: 2-oxoacid:acceptor oxidoreductase subunit alpha [Chloroflexi bacterium]|nr:2-oxoacid:acceptor oxidoreductase subunit alpha [Chloroflexota bacterium]